MLFAEVCLLPEYDWLSAIARAAEELFYRPSSAQGHGPIHTKQGLHSLKE